jgi:RNA polymerase sigma-70 factor, ECF subfamily
MSVAEALPARSRCEHDLQGLYERHSDRIFAFCRSRLRSHQEAEDAVQTTFLQALRALQRGVVPVSETAWLYKIAENVCLSTHRSNGRRSERELADGGEVVELAPAREARDDALFGLEEALAGIPENQRRAFVLRELRGLSYKEIAGVAGLSVTAVEMLVFRARRSLAQALESGALKGRVASVLDLGAALHAVKTALGGASVAKVVSAAVLVAIATVPAGDSPVPPPDRSPTTVRTQAYERLRGSEGTPSPLQGTHRSARSQRSGRGGGTAKSSAASRDGTAGGIPIPQRGRIEDEASAPADTPVAADPPAGNATPREPVPAPAIEPRVPDPVQLPSTPTISEPQVPALPVDAPKLPLEAPVPPELPVKLPEPPKVELPALPTVP